MHHVLWNPTEGMHLPGVCHRGPWKGTPCLPGFHLREHLVLPGYYVAKTIRAFQSGELLFQSDLAGV